MEILIKASDFNTETIPELMDELWDNPKTQGIVYRIADYLGCGVGDAMEGVASHIIYTDEDYTLTIPDIVYEN